MSRKLPQKLKDALLLCHRYNSDIVMKSDTQAVWGGGGFRMHTLIVSFPVLHAPGINIIGLEPGGLRMHAHALIRFWYI